MNIKSIIFFTIFRLILIGLALFLIGWELMTGSARAQATVMDHLNSGLQEDADRDARMAWWREARYGMCVYYSIWGFKGHGGWWMPPENILSELAEVVSKGGNFLLNVGSDGSGIIPPTSINNLLLAGEWLELNGEAIYGAQRSPLTEPISDAWITTKNGTMYAVLHRRPADGVLRLPHQKNAGVRAARVSVPDDMLDVRFEPGTVSILLPENAANDLPEVIKIEGM